VIFLSAFALAPALALAGHREADWAGGVALALGVLGAAAIGVGLFLMLASA
jgi:hypothetical protein